MWRQLYKQTYYIIIVILSSSISDKYYCFTNSKEVVIVVVAAFVEFISFIFSNEQALLDTKYIITITAILYWFWWNA